MSAKGREVPDDLDVVLPYAPTDDSAGARVLRARLGRLEAGEVRPASEGKPVMAGELVRLEQRADAPMLYDVKVDHAARPAPLQRDSKGPAQVATRAYRDAWERVFGARPRNEAPN